MFYIFSSGMYKVPPPPPLEGKCTKYVGEEYQVVKRGRNIMAVGKNITWKKEKGGLKDVGKYFKWGEGKETEIF